MCLESLPSASSSESCNVVRRRNVSGGNGGAPYNVAKVENVNNNNDYTTQMKKLMPPKPTNSSGVTFHPPSDKYWHIGGKWYDFTMNDFISRHPGGSDVLLLARDRFEDATFVFESHHYNYKRVRKIISKYEVDESVVRMAGLRRTSSTAGARGQHRIDNSNLPKLLDDDAFYSVIRRRVTEYLISVGYPNAGPTLQCKVLFWMSFIAWLSCYLWLFSTCSIIPAVCTGLTASWLGAFGHNWVHQPKYKFWAYLSLDTIGFSVSSEQVLFRRHFFIMTCVQKLTHSLPPSCRVMPGFGNTIYNITCIPTHLGTITSRARHPGLLQIQPLRGTSYKSMSCRS